MTVLIVPAAMTLFLIVLQVGLWWHGTTVATAAAQHSLDAARVAGGNEAAGEATGQQFIQQLGGLRRGVVDAHRDGDQMRVTVTAESISVLADLPLGDISVSLSAPVEQIVQ